MPGQAPRQRPRSAPRRRAGSRLSGPGRAGPRRTRGASSSPAPPRERARRPPSGRTAAVARSRQRSLLRAPRQTPVQSWVQVCPRALSPVVRYKRYLSLTYPCFAVPITALPPAMARVGARALPPGRAQIRGRARKSGINTLRSRVAALTMNDMTTMSRASEPSTRHGRSLPWSLFESRQGSLPAEKAVLAEQIESALTAMFTQLSGCALRTGQVPV